LWLRVSVVGGTDIACSRVSTPRTRGVVRDVDTQVLEADVLADEFEAFYRRWFPAVARSMALVVQDAESGKEIAQDGFRKTWERWARLKSLDHARNFVFRVSMNEARSILRHRQRMQLLRIHRSDPSGDPATGDDRPGRRLPRPLGPDHTRARVRRPHRLLGLRLRHGRGDRRDPTVHRSGASRTRSREAAGPPWGER